MKGLSPSLLLGNVELPKRDYESQQWREKRPDFEPRGGTQEQPERYPRFIGCYL
jgi:hypothetical protein